MTKQTTNKIIRIFSFIKRAIRGESMDYTSVGIRTAVFMLAIPMILEMLMESVFALVDLFFVGHLEHSENTLQTVALTESLLYIVYSVAIGISMAATAVVARRIGEKNEDEAAHSGMQAIWLAIFITTIMSSAGFIWAPDFLKLMGADPLTVSMGTTYARTMFGGCIVIMMLYLINGIFRGAGDASMAMKSLWVANLCNIVLCPLLINGLGP